MNTKRRMASWVVLPMMLAITGVAHADVIYTATLNTSSLMAAGGDFALAFQFNDGTGAGDGNNTATLSDFNFGGGSASGCPLNCQLTGGASGDATSTVLLNDSSFFNSFAERFTPGSSLSFKLALTTNVENPADFFGFSILNSGASLPTQDDLLADNLVYFNLDSATPTPASFATVAGTPIALDAPTLRLAPPVGQAPEPGSLLLVGLGLVALVGVGRRKLTQ